MSSDKQRDQQESSKHSPHRTSVLEVFIESQVSLRSFISRFIVSSHDIDDVSQEAFLRAYKAEQKTSIKNPKAFIFRVAKNLLMNEFNRKSRKVTDYIEDLDVLDLLPDEDTLEANIIAQQWLGLYCEAIASLPKQCRQVMLMKKLYGFSTKEVARRLGIATSTVEKHMTKGLKDCNALLAERYRDEEALENKPREGQPLTKKEFRRDW